MPNLARPTNSLVNNIMAHSKQTIPSVGMGCTQLCWSDRHAFTIVEIISPKEIKVQADTAVRVDKNGMSESQDYRFEPNPNGRTEIVTLRKNGRWVTQGSAMNNGTSWFIGDREEYYDYSF